ncbi:hypothetical protein I302_107193 [Kwoniella bestiolae CBS 10118]|uniref:Uncharacterized protein n=1 Tax=Kwoniella bestiolae CBS 10118 TaxID=1296100 RepID=A0A1B9FZ94_9TREE|nr:hypothetical protein I302_05541 [Kwoniella bestiolae CBS 10118]OCF24084.1 hypothetical protein I302_05541 [Kwoniella bestiolae CBS 10118]
MQLQNASTVGYGSVVRLSANVSWAYPFLPGEPPNVIRYQFAGCVPSNITIASTCCTAVNGTFVNEYLNNTRSLSADELKSIFGNDTKATSGWNVGNLTEAADAGTEGNIHWCTMAYNPMSSESLQGSGYQSGPTLGNVPEAMQKWIQCFNDNVPQDAVNKSQAAYVCATDDARKGGTIEGFNRYIGQQGSGASNRLAYTYKSWWNVLGLMVVVVACLN